MSILTEKPWLAQEMGAWPDNECRYRRQLTGLRFLLAVIGSMFLLFMVAMIMRTQLGDWQPLTEQPWQPLFDTGPLWRNTACLLASSVLVQVAYFSVRPAPVLAQGLMVFGAASALLFLYGQWELWELFSARQFGVQSSVSASFFYLLTGLHGLHLLVGLLFWPRSFVALWRGKSQLARERLALMLTYWHFLALIWLALFALLTSTPQTYRALAALCGVSVP
ncbi:cytochrome c oxidase subunit 3 [Ferrimonas gelatinilytica]|uniref:Heme-copper oxidase subunit III family profile domain-containing protein n=1 Tax=Ferrimonas gelatinilytica TaxID=1255257 RepID=A0ABP9RXQ5_9GAMM